MMTNTKGTDNMVAKTIQTQLGNKCFFMLGAFNLVDCGDGLSFRFKGSRKANYCKVTLAGNDTYTVEFLKIGRAPNFSQTEVRKESGVYADMLHAMIESTTGLATSLGTLGR